MWIKKDLLYLFPDEQKMLSKNRFGEVLDISSERAKLIVMHANNCFKKC